MTDQTLILRIKNKDKSAYKELYDRYAHEMFSCSFRITNNKEESKDILQEAFLKSFQRLSSLNNDSHYRPWLKKIVINKSLEYLRQSSFASLNDSLEIEDSITDSKWFENISLEQIKEEVQALSNKCRVVFTLYAFEGLIHKEIAQLLKISESTSKSQYKYACNILKKKLAKYVDYEI